MKKLILFAVICGCVSLGLYAYFAQTSLTEILPSPIPFTELNVPTPEATAEPEVPLEEKVGALFMLGHWAHTPVASTTSLLIKHNIGGVIIMSAPENIDDISEWTSEWQKVSDGKLIISIDQEGGKVTRLKGSDYTQKNQREIKTPAEAYALGKERGKELAELGVTMNFAPVLDTAKNPSSFMYQRVFSDRILSSELANQMIEGMESQEVTAVAKHFPGHDDTVDDSHNTLPTVFVSKDGLDEFTLPFRGLIKNGKPKALMTAHVLFPKIDERPATLSSFFLTEYLRENLGFTGVVFTDDMSMDAIDKNYGLGTASVMAIQAGADIILFAAEPEKVAIGIEAVMNAVENKTLSKEHIDESYQRVQTLR